MAGKILIDIISTANGLFGGTKDKVNIPLSKPEPKATQKLYETRITKELEGQFEKDMRSIISSADDNTYFQLGEIEHTLDGYIKRGYNIFRRRE